MPLGSQHGPQKLPKSLPKASRNQKKRSKIDSKNWSKFCMPFEWLLGPTWPQNGPQSPPQEGGHFAPLLGLGRVLGGPWVALGAQQRIVFRVG